MALASFPGNTWRVQYEYANQVKPDGPPIRSAALIAAGDIESASALAGSSAGQANFNPPLPSGVTTITIFAITRLGSAQDVVVIDGAPSAP
jgi:hypothetical protein